MDERCPKGKPSVMRSGLCMYKSLRSYCLKNLCKSTKFCLIFRRVNLRFLDYFYLLCKPVNECIFVKNYVMSKINKLLNVLIILTLFFMIGKSLYVSYQEKQKLQNPKYEMDLTLDDAKKYFPEADSIALDEVALYNVFREKNHIGTIVNTSPYSDEVFGYNGRTPLTICLDSENRIFEVEICENRESMGYLRRVINSGFFDSWDGLTPEEALAQQVDAVSGCTYTSLAVSKSLQARMQNITDHKVRLRSWDNKLFVRQLSVLIVTILSLICFFNPKKIKILRYVTLVLSIVILGFWTNSLLSLALFYNWITNGISLSMQIPILIIAAFAILLPLFTKKSFYCQYLCPFGAVQEFVGMIPNKRQKSKVESQKGSATVNTVFKIFSLLRRVVLLVLLALVAFGVGLDLSVVEPFPVFNYQSIGFGLAIFVAVIVIASIFFRKPWCNYLCPTGTLLEIFRKRIVK